MHIKKIDSLQNQTIKNIVKLHVSKGRHELKQFIAEGLRVCLTLLESNLPLVQIYATESTLQDVAALDPRFVTLVSFEVMKKISTMTSPSGILGVFELPQVQKHSELTAGLVLADIADPGNMGTLLRTAAAMNVGSVVVVNGADIFSPKVIQASAGCIAKLNVFTMSWQELLAAKKDLSLAALVVSGGENITEIDAANSLLVVGNEAHGIKQEWLRSCDLQVTLPMNNNVESLNAAVAGSIALYILHNT